MSKDIEEIIQDEYDLRVKITRWMREHEDLFWDSEKDEDFGNIYFYDESKVPQFVLDFYKAYNENNDRIDEYYKNNR